MLNKLYISFLELIAPKHCFRCDKHLVNDLSSSSWLCKVCLDRLPYAESNLHIYNHILNNLPTDQVFIDNSTSLLSLKEDDKFHELIIKLKYHGFSKIAYEFGLLLGKRLLIENFTGYDYVIPVPIHSAKKRQRGYNQSELLAKAVGETINSSHHFSLIKRNVFTKTQTKLSKEARFDNIKNVFEINKKFNDHFNNLSVLIVDDVLTTGATLNECARLLKINGAARVDIATIAHA